MFAQYLPADKRGERDENKTGEYFPVYSSTS